MASSGAQVFGQVCDKADVIEAAGLAIFRELAKLPPEDVQAAIDWARDNAPPDPREENKKAEEALTAAQKEEKAALQKAAATRK